MYLFELLNIKKLSECNLMYFKCSQKKVEIIHSFYIMEVQLWLDGSQVGKKARKATKVGIN